MKKFIVGLLFISALTTTVEAQFTTPRTGTGFRYDARKLNYVYKNITDAASATADTFAVAPNAYLTTYRIALTDSLYVSAPTLTNCYAGDKIQMIVSAASGTPVLKFVTSTNWVTAGTATMTTRLRAVIDFVFDGAKWVEAGRYVQ